MSITARARCSSRARALGQIAFADDGSNSARTAEAVLATWPIFAHRAVTVLTVAETAVPVAAGFTPGLYDQVLASYTRIPIDEAREETRIEADTAAGRLGGLGMDAQPVVLEGDAAGEIVRFAGERGIGTIVMGTRGHTGTREAVAGQRCPQRAAPRPVLGAGGSRAEGLSRR